MSLSRKTALSRGAGPQRRTPLASGRTRLRAFSPKRAAARPKRREVVAAVLERDGHRCQAPHDLMVGLAGCFGHLDVHELTPRSGWPAGYLVPSNCLTVARSCHQWIDDHPTAAHALGLHRMSWERSA